MNQFEDENFIKHVVNLYSGMIIRIAFHYVKNKADAEDVMQDVFLSLIKQTTSFSDEHLKAWLIRVTINKCKNFLKSAHKRRTVNLEEAGQLFTEIETQFLEELHSLPEDDRNILYLFYFEGYSAKEVAGILNLKIAAVFKRLSRAREKLKMFLEVEDEKYL